jgi:hypothetical protein
MIVRGAETSEVEAGAGGVPAPAGFAEPASEPDAGMACAGSEGSEQPDPLVSARGPQPTATPVSGQPVAVPVPAGEDGSRHGTNPTTDRSTT